MTLAADRLQAVDAEVLRDKGGRFRLVSHQLSAGAAATYRLGFGQALRVGWSFGRPPWRLRLDFAAARSTDSGDSQEVDATGARPNARASTSKC